LVGYSVVNNSQVCFLLHHRLLLCCVANARNHSQKFTSCRTCVLYLSLERDLLQLFQVNFKLFQLFIRPDIVLEGNSCIFSSVGNNFLQNTSLIFQVLRCLVSELHCFVKQYLHNNVQSHYLVLENICKIFRQLLGVHNLDVSVGHFCQLPNRLNLASLSFDGYNVHCDVFALGFLTQLSVELLFRLIIGLQLTHADIGKSISAEDN
jgi:hypothetical protein